MNKKLCLSISLLALLATASSVVLTNQNISEIGGKATGSNAYELTIDHLYQTHVYSNSGNINYSYAVAQLTRPGTYVILANHFYTGGHFYNDGTKIFENSFLYKEGIDYANRFGFFIDAQDSFYMSPGDAEPINAIGFSDLRKVQIFMGEDNQLQYDLEGLSERGQKASYDEVTNSYTIEGPISSLYSAYMPDCYTGTPETNSGKKLVIKKLVLTYGCNG